MHALFYKHYSFKVLFAFLLIIAAGCQVLPVENEPECSNCDRSFEVHINSNFDNDRVRIEIDGLTVFNERVTTNPVLSLAEIIELKRPAGVHRIRVVVNGSKAGEKTFSLDQKLYIQVRFYPEAIPDLNIPEGVSIYVSEIQPMYD